MFEEYCVGDGGYDELGGGVDCVVDCVLNKCDIE